MTVVSACYVPIKAYYVSVHVFVSIILSDEYLQYCLFACEGGMGLANCIALVAKILYIALASMKLYVLLVSLFPGEITSSEIEYIFLLYFYTFMYMYHFSTI